MISKAVIGQITSLHHGKFRDLHNEFLAEGPKVVGELLQSDFRLHRLCATKEWLVTNNALLIKDTAEVFEVTGKELGRLSALTTPNSVLAIFEKAAETEEINIANDELVLALDNISDPGNLGTIVRIADWFGISKVICSMDTVDIYNPKTVQATMGSIASVKVLYRNLFDFIKADKPKVEVFALSLEGENLFMAEIPKGAILIIGSESHGISGEVLGIADKKLFIPPYINQNKEGRSAESLNASVAAAIVCAEFRRRTDFTGN